MQKEQIREVVVDTYLKNDKDIEATMGALSTLPEPLNQLINKKTSAGNFGLCQGLGN